MMMRWQTLTLESSASHAREWYSSARAPSAIRAQYTRAKNAAAIAGRKTNEMMRVLGTNRAKHTCGVWAVGGLRRGSGAELAHKIACWVRRWRFACPWRITPWLADGIRVRAHLLNSKDGEEDLVEHVRVPEELDALGRLEPRVREPQRQRVRSPRLGHPARPREVWMISADDRRCGATSRDLGDSG